MQAVTSAQGRLRRRGGEGVDVSRLVPEDRPYQWLQSRGPMRGGRGWNG